MCGVRIVFGVCGCDVCFAYVISVIVVCVWCVCLFVSENVFLYMCFCGVCVLFVVCVFCVCFGVC